MRDLDDLFAQLQQSRFRQRQRLRAKDLDYLRTKGMATVMRHARDFIHQRLAPAQPRNDGRQTPMRGHPVFVAQHATGTCCRGCLAKWLHIDKGRPLRDVEVERVLAAIERWLLHAHPQNPDNNGEQLELFR